MKEPYKLSVTIYSLRGYVATGRISVPQFIDLMAELGAEGVDLGYYWRSEEEKAEAKKKLEERGLELAIYITSTDFAKPSEEERKREVKKAKQAVDEAKKFGASKLRVHPGNLQLGMDPNEAEKWVAESLADVVDYAADEGIVIAMENHGRYFAKIDVVERLLKAVNSPYLRLTFDSGNFARAGDNPLEAASRLGSWVAHVHAKDVDAWGRPCAPGEGTIDFEAIINQLLAQGFSGFLSVEYEGGRDQLLGVGIGLGYLRALRTKMQLR
jgi:sugar phosphate isomerase/epimerase